MRLQTLRMLAVLLAVLLLTAGGCLRNSTLIGEEAVRSRGLSEYAYDVLSNSKNVLDAAVGYCNDPASTAAREKYLTTITGEPLAPSVDTVCSYLKTD